MPQHLRLISHKLCPYVQRAVIVATEKGIPYERIDIDLANRPDWFLAISPTGKVPVLEVVDDQGNTNILFESAVIAEYLDEVSGDRLLPADPMQRARERAWVEFASATLGNIGQLYSAPSRDAFEVQKRALEGRLAALEPEIAGPWFSGDRFGLVDAAFGPLFRYLDVFEWRLGTPVVDLPAKVRAWSTNLAKRPSVRTAVSNDYAELLIDFIAARNSFLGKKLERYALEPAAA